MSSHRDAAGRLDPFGWLEDVLRSAVEMELSDRDTRERVFGFAFLLSNADEYGSPRMTEEELARLDRIVELLDHVGFLDAALPALGADQ